MRRAAWRSVAMSAGARFLVMPLTAVVGLVATRLILDEYGQHAYVQYGLLVGLAGLLPFADLGLSAAVMNAVGESEDPRRDAELRRTLLTTIRLLLLSGAVIVVVAAALTWGGAWPSLLGDALLPGSGPLVAGLCLALVGVTLPFGVGQRILTGLGKNHLTIFITGVQAPLVLLGVWLTVQLGVSAGGALAALPYLAILLLALVLCWVAGRLIRPTLSQALREVPRRVPGARVGHLAWPMLVLMVATPLAMQSDRIVLSHVSTVAQLAEYSLAAQMFLPIWHLSNAAGNALWAVFARERAQGEHQSPAAFALVFGGIAAVAAGLVSLASPLLAELASGGQIRISTEVLVAFSVLQVVQAAKYPFGVYLTDSQGLRFQVWMVLAMLPVNLGLSIVLGRSLGAVGPLVGSAVGVGVFQLLANGWYARRVLRARRAAAREPAVVGEA